MKRASGRLPDERPAAMNLMLLEEEADELSLKRDDPRAIHIVEILGMGEGDSLDIGVINGPRGKARIERADDKQITLSLVFGELPPPPPPIHLLVGMCRPQTARKILREVTALGVRRIVFFEGTRSDRSYAKSRLWTTGEWKRHLKEGAEQAFHTQIPEIDWKESLSGAIAVLNYQHLT